MDERRTAESAVISEYFETMRQFLETQERVMKAFLGDTGALRPPARTHLLPLSAPGAAAPRAAELAAAPVVVPTARQYVPAPAAPVPVAAHAPSVEAPPPHPPPAAPPPAAPPPAAAPAAAKISQAPFAAPPPPASATQAPKTNGAGLTRDKLLDALLGIVEEKTGYPRDMLGLDQNLEADLGIDSIKRVEVVGALLKFLPDGYREALSSNRGKLNTQSTLNGMLDLITHAKVGEAAGPFDSAGVGLETDVVSHPPRLVMRSQRESILPGMGRRLSRGPFVLTRDHGGVADLLAIKLRTRGADVFIVEPDVLAAEERLLEFCERRSVGAKLGGIVHLAALGAPALTADQGPAEWRAVIQIHEKSFFLLLRQLQSRLTEGAHVVAASGLGGLFGRDGSATGALQIQGGAPGTLKSLFEERGDLRVKAVDLDPRRGAMELVGDLLAEIELDGGRQEVGYPGGDRTIFVTTGEAVRVDPARNAQLENLVVLATGGARGITAEVLRELARPGNTLILTGRSRLPETEAADTAALAGADALRAHFVAQVRTGTVKLTPGDIHRRVQSIMDLREVRANLADFRAAGSAAEYHSVDVTDETALGALIADIKRRHGRIDGVVHGAGVIEDKLLVDKQSDSWSRVIDTKLIGLLLLQKLVDPAALKFFTVFSSVAGRYGNSGQSDYATANELMNRICVALQARWGSAVAVSALCWGPWGPTKFGAGMVTAETERKFEQRGVYLVSAALGRRLFREELGRSSGTPVEVICGQGPWESEETRRGVVRAAEPPEAKSPLGPLLGNADVVTRPTGEKVLMVRLDSSRHSLLQDHAVDGRLTLVPAAALELLAEAARSVWPRWCMAEVREFRLLQPIDLREGICDLQIHLSPPPYGSSEGFEVSASIEAESGSGRSQVHARCVLRMELTLPSGVAVQRGVHAEKSLAVSVAYGEWLSRGARLQVIEAIDGLSPAGASAQARGTRPAQWMADGRPGHWLFDPALLDAAAQLVALWARSYGEEAAVSACYGRVVRYRDELPARVHMEFTRADSPDPGMIRGNVVFFDGNGTPVLAIEDLDSALVARASTADDAVVAETLLA
jgi:NAD(P)-dependent dehydrogenase (short-subunit alcohol dehydrogenase family)